MRDRPCLLLDAGRDRMAKTSEQMKALVEEFIKVTKTEYADQTRQARSRNPSTEWQFHVGDNITVNKNASRDDRIHISINARFTPEESKLMVQTNPIFSRASLKISEICAICAVGHQWIKAGNELVGLAVFSHIDEKVLDRVSFHNAWDNIARVIDCAQHILRANFVAGQKN